MRKKLNITGRLKSFKPVRGLNTIYYLRNNRHSMTNIYTITIYNNAVGFVSRYQIWKYITHMIFKAIPFTPYKRTLSRTKLLNPPTPSTSTIWTPPNPYLLTPNADQSISAGPSNDLPCVELSLNGPSRKARPHYE